MKVTVLAASLVIGFLICGSACPAAASPFGEQDQEANDVAFFVSQMAGRLWEKDILDDYPDATITWGGRAYFPRPDKKAQWMVYAEVRQEGKDPVYFVYELTINAVEDWTKLGKN